LIPKADYDVAFPATKQAFTTKLAWGRGSRDRRNLPCRNLFKPKLTQGFLHLLFLLVLPGRAPLRLSAARRHKGGRCQDSSASFCFSGLPVLDNPCEASPIQNLAHDIYQPLNQLWLGLQVFLGQRPRISKNLQVVFGNRRTGEIAKRFKKARIAQDIEACVIEVRQINGRLQNL